jgi:hypothetical protein
MDLESLSVVGGWGNDPSFLATKWNADRFMVPIPTCDSPPHQGTLIGSYVTLSWNKRLVDYWAA